MPPVDLDPSSNDARLEEVLQAFLQAQNDLRETREVLDSLLDRLYFHGEMQWRNVAGELAGRIEAHAHRRYMAINLLLELQTKEKPAVQGDGHHVGPVHVA